MTASSSSPKKTFLDSFPAPEYLLVSTTGVAITDKEIRSVRFRHGIFSRCLGLVHSGSTPTPTGSLEGGFIRDATKLAAALGELAVKYGLKFVHATLPEEKAYLFTATIDKVPREGLRDAVAFIIEENVPVTLADSIFYFEVVKPVEDGAKLKVAVSVMPKNIVNAYIEVFESAGLIPISFDIESQAITRALVPQGDKLIQLIINIGDNKTGFYVVEDEVVQFSTTIPSGTEGDRYRAVNDLKMELRKIFAFWNSRVDKRGFPEGNIEKVLLSGPGALKEDFVKEFMTEASVEYALGNPWINTDCEENLPQKEGIAYASAIGLALPKKNRNV